MKNAVVFPLQTSTVYSRDPKQTFETLDRLLKNSILFFEELWIETGIHQVTYGDTFDSAFDLPYKGIDEYRKIKNYETAGTEKRQAMIAIKPEGEPKAEFTTLASLPARSYIVSLQGAFECLLENHSRTELDFVKYIWVEDLCMHACITLSKILDLRKESSLKEFRKAIAEITRRLDGIPDKESYAAISQETNKRLIKDTLFTLKENNRSLINYDFNYMSGISIFL